MRKGSVISKAEVGSEGRIKENDVKSKRYCAEERQGQPEVVPTENNRLHQFDSGFVNAMWHHFFTKVEKEDATPPAVPATAGHE